MQEKSDESLLAALLKIAGLYQVGIEQELQAIGLSRTLYETLEQLAGAGAALSQRELARRQECAPSNITQKIDRLQKQGLVRRTSDPEDRRTILAELTPLGRERASAGARIISRLQGEMQGMLSAADREHLGRILAVLGRQGGG